MNFEQAKKYNLDFNMKMTVAEMKSKIKEAQKAEEEAKNAANTSEGDK